MIKVYYALTTDVVKEPLLTEKDEKRLSRINSQKNKHEFTFSHTVLNTVLTSELGLNIADLTLRYNQHGKPYLTNNLFDRYNETYFSLTHSTSGVAVAICCGVEAGIDIEDTTRRDPEACKRLAARFFHRSEIEYLSSLKSNEAEYISRFFQIWTLKEAYLKAIGTGINTTLSTLFFNISGDTIMLSGSESGAITSHRFFSCELEDYSLSIAYASNCQEEIELIRFCQ